MLATLDQVFIVDGHWGYELLQEGQWVRGRFASSLRIDRPAHGVGQTHAHVYGHRGNQLGVVNWDGTGSHGTKMRLYAQDANALRVRGFNIPVNNIIEWLQLPGHSAEVLLG